MRLRLTCVFMGLLILAASRFMASPRLSVAQQPSSENTCNQPMPEAITHFKVVDDTGFFRGIASHDGCWIFLLERSNNKAGARVAVISREKGALKQIRTVDLGVQGGGGMALTPDGKTLIASTGSKTVFLDVGLLTSGREPVSGAVTYPRSDSGGLQPTSLTQDGEYLFVSHRLIAWISVVDVARGRSSPGNDSAVIGGFPTGPSPINLVLSPDGRYLYTTSGADDPTQRPGELVVIDIQRARSGGTSPIIAKVPAGRDPVWIALAPDGDTVYVAARLDGAVLAFDMRPVRSGKDPALIGKVSVGPLPTHVEIIEDGKKIVVANSTNAGDGIQPMQTLTVLDAARIASGGQAILGTIPTGADPRHAFLTHDGRTLMVTNLGSRTLQIIDLARVTLQP